MNFHASLILDLCLESSFKHAKYVQPCVLDSICSNIVTLSRGFFFRVLADIVSLSADVEFSFHRSLTATMFKKRLGKQMDTSSRVGLSLLSRMH